MAPRVLFDLGRVENSKYGSATNLKGELPLLSFFQYKLPRIYEDRAQVDRGTKYLLEKFKHLWPPGGKEGHNRGRAALSLIVPNYGTPQLDWDKDHGLRLAAEFWMAAFVLDDIADSVLRIVSGRQSHRVILAFVQNFGNADDVNFEDFIPGYTSDPTSSMYYFGKGVATMHQAIRNLRSICPEDEMSKFELFMEELKNATIAHYLTIGGKSSEEDFQFSNETYTKHLAQHLHASRLSVGISVLLNPAAKLPSEVRDSLLFKMLMDSCGNIMAWLNAILGLQRDIRQDSWADTIILRNVLERNWSLQEAFDFTLAAYKSEVRDANLLFEILEETYGDIEGVDELLEAIHNTVSGTGAAYADEYASSRYGVEIELADSDTSIEKKPKVEIEENEGKMKYNTIISFVENPNAALCDC